MSRNARARLAWLAAAAVIVASLTGCGPARFNAPKEKSAKRIEVVASTDVWGEIAKEIGGDKVHVTTIIRDGSVDPHLYEPTAADAAAIAKAQVVVMNGAGYDDFMYRLVRGAGTKPSIVIAQKEMHATGKNVNPHLWYALANMPDVADSMARAFAHYDPAGASAFQGRSAKFEDALFPVFDVVRQISRKYRNAPVAYTERLPQYLLVLAGLRNVTPPGFAQSVENGTNPSPADTQAMYSLISEHKIKLLIYNTQTVSATTSNVKARAEKAGIPVVGLAETMPTSQPNFAAWMRGQAQEILAALNRSR